MANNSPCCSRDVNETISEFSCSVKLTTKITTEENHNLTTIYNIEYFLGNCLLPILSQNLVDYDQEKRNEIISKTILSLDDMIKYSLRHPENVVWFPTDPKMGNGCHILCNNIVIRIICGVFVSIPLDPVTKEYKREQTNYATKLEKALKYMILYNHMQKYG